MEESHGYDVNSGAGLFLICPRTRRILLGLRNTKGESEGGTWCTFGGLMQNKEAPLSAAIRETMEESEIEADTVIKNPLFVNTNIDHEDAGFNFYTFLGILDSERDPVINDEHTDYNWFRLSELHNINLHKGVKTLLSDEGSLETLKNHLYT